MNTSARVAATILAAAFLAAPLLAPVAEAAPAIQKDPCARPLFSFCLPDLYLSTIYQLNATGGYISLAPTGSIVVYPMVVGNGSAYGTASGVEVRWWSDWQAGLSQRGWQFVSFTTDSGFFCHEPGPEMVGEQVWCEGGTIGPGQLAHITLTMRAPDPGTHPIAISLDPDNSILESNESNNKLCCLTLGT